MNDMIIASLHEVSSGTNRPHVQGANNPAALTETSCSIPSLRRYRKIVRLFGLNTAEATEVGTAAASSNRSEEKG
jgi:hypothetical protein